MAKDDYYVIVYKILAYLYKELKNGNKPNINMIQAEGGLFCINYNYWFYIIEHMLKESYIEGVNIKKYFGGKDILNLEDINITPKGISYLNEDVNI